MKIHMRPPLLTAPPAPPPKTPPTAFQLEMQAHELAKIAEQQQTRLKKLYCARKNRPGSDEDSDSEPNEKDRSPKRNLDFLA